VVGLQPVELILWVTDGWMDGWMPFATPPTVFVRFLRKLAIQKKTVEQIFEILLEKFLANF